MCGIIAILSKNKLNDMIYNCLIQLKNRGYDSCGVSSIINNNIIINKYASDKINSFDKLKDNMGNHLDSSISIAHTRWATHGGKTDLNSHPHLSFNNKICLVHNGIIENYLELKLKLQKENYKFKSSTDTEVIVNLLEYEYLKCNDIMLSLKKTITQLEGSWGLVFFCIDNPKTLFCTRSGNPLLIGSSDNNIIVSSEISGFNNNVNNYFILKNNDICLINLLNNKLIINTEEIYEKIKLEYQKPYKLPDNFNHWTLKEIYEQPESIERAMSIGSRILKNDKIKLEGFDSFKNELLKIDNLILLGCGTSYFAGLYSIDSFKELSNFNTVQIFDGADFNVKDIPKIGVSGCIFLSQSGETKDLHRCINICKEINIIKIGVINVQDSMIARETDCVCYLNAGKEFSVASTKSFTSQVIILTLIAIWFAQNRDINLIKRIEYINDLKKLNVDFKKCIKNSEKIIPEIINLFDNENSCFILGKGSCEAIAKEGSLKIKEISYIHAEGYSTSSLKHGPFALLDKNFPVIILGTVNNNFRKVMNAYEEVKTRDAKIIFISDKELNLDNLIRIPNNKTFKNLLCIIPIQMIAYNLSINRNINPDTPKNLAKVVTVE